MSELVAVEPEDYLRAKAAEAARDSGRPIRVIDAVADALPFEDGHFDAAVAALVLCSVPSQPAALAELRRVVRPGGELRFYEHVAARSKPLSALQRGLAPGSPSAWRAAAGADHDTGRGHRGGRIGASSATAASCSRSRRRVPGAPRILGAARRA